MDLKNTDDLFSSYFIEKDLEIRNALFSRYMHLAEILSKKFLSRGVDYDDLYQIACVALLEALERFDPTKGVLFQTFATTTIIGKIKNYIRDKSNVIKMPRRNFELLSKINKSKEFLTHHLGRIPNIYEISQHLLIDEDVILESLEAQYSCDTVSLDSLICPENEQEVSFFIGQEDESFKNIEDKDFFQKNLQKFNEMEKTLIFERFYNERTQRELAELLGVSQMYVSRLERKILKKLHEEFHV